MLPDRSYFSLFLLKYGYIESYKDSVACIRGLDQTGYGELIYSGGNRGLVLSVLSESFFAVFFSEINLGTGCIVTSSKSLPFIKSSSFLLGFIVNATGLPVASFRSSSLSLFWVSYSLLSSSVSYPILSRQAPSITSRLSIYEPVSTGIKMVDGLIPIGCGQRELILGDRQTGKSTLGLDALLNNK